MENHDLIDSFIEIEPVDSDSFLKIKETLTRIGIASRKTGEKPILWQSCHILHKRGRYFLVHFKQMFLLDGKSGKTDISEDDVNRTHVIANLLEQWGLVKLKSDVKEISADSINLVVLPYSNKAAWNLKSKYSIGKANHGKAQ